MGSSSIRQLFAGFVCRGEAAHVRGVQFAGVGDDQALWQITIFNNLQTDLVTHAQLVLIIRHVAIEAGH